MLSSKTFPFKFPFKWKSFSRKAFILFETIKNFQSLATWHSIKCEIYYGYFSIRRKEKCSELMQNRCLTERRGWRRAKRSEIIKSFPRALSRFLNNQHCFDIIYSFCFCNIKLKRWGSGMCSVVWDLNSRVFQVDFLELKAIKLIWNGIC